MYIAFLLLSLFLAGGDEGVGLDPFGGRVTAQGDGGPGMDPNG